MYASSILLITIPATALSFSSTAIKQDRVTAQEMTNRYKAAFDHFSGKWLVKLLKLEPLTID